MYIISEIPEKRGSWKIEEINEETFYINLLEAKFGIQANKNYQKSGGEDEK